MRGLTLILGLFFALTVTAQGNYEKGMNKAFELWGQGKVAEAANLFERISNAEKDNWIPAYYTGYIKIISSFGIKDEAQLKANIENASGFLDKAMTLSPNNPEIMIMQALANTAFISFDGQKYGMTLSGKNVQIYTKALELAPKNPRVILSKAEWDMGGAKFFGKSTEPYCKDVKKALELFDSQEKNELKFYPSWGKDRAQQILKTSCGS